MLKTATLLCAVLAAPPALAQTLYKVVGPDGKVSYQSEKPADGKISKTLVVAPRAADAAPAAKGRVVLYAAAWCGYCRQAKAYLAAKRIAYEEIDVDTNYGKSAFARVTGVPPIPANQRAGGIPLLVMGSVKHRGYSTAMYDDVFATYR